MIKKDNKKYWDFFYKKEKKELTKQTNFASFVLKKIKKSNFLVYDVGCGNGRDTIYFNKNKINCSGIDRSKTTILNLKKKYRIIEKKFILANFCDFFNKKVKKNFIIYSRFSWHTINYYDEKKFLNNLKKQKKLKYIFIETRTIKDDLYGKGKKVGRNEYILTHYRRFIDPKELLKKLSTFSKIIYFKESRNFAKYKKENPSVLRCIIKVN